MKVVICDGCETELVNRKRGVYQRYDQVSISRQERIDLCATCYPHFGTLQEKLKSIGDRGLARLDEIEKQAIADFWEAVKRGKQETEADPAGR